MQRASAWFLALPIGVLLAHGCSPGSGTNKANASGGTETGSGASGGASSGKGGKGSTIDVDAGDQAGASAEGGGGPIEIGGCGDGILQPARGEACDDGNNAASDGCAADCSQVEQNFACLTPGEPCSTTVMCGDSAISGAETCDDGGTTPADGCDAFCQVEAGWLCEVAGAPCHSALCGDGIIAGLEQCEDNDGATPTGGDGCNALCQVEVGWVCEAEGQACRQAVCGDGIVEGGEPCDELDDVIGDGCSPGCLAEPTCEYPIDTDGCTSQCGDGLYLPGDVEECDDGNRRNDDGCSADCLEEDGYDCVLQAGTLPDTLTLPFVFRDFVAFPAQGGAVQRHPDFQNGCLGTVAENMVLDALDAEGKPLNSELCALPAAPDCVPDVDYVSPLGPVPYCLDRDGCVVGGIDGCDRSTHPNHPLATHPDDDPFHFWYRDTPDVSKRIVQPIILNRVGSVYSFNSNALFPLDGLGWVAQGEELPRNGHNFGFTSEVRYWFQFFGGETLEFSGDDDLFVFVGGQLALAIGSKHQQTTRTVVLNGDGTATCAACAIPSRPVDLYVGAVYEIAIFHAERQSEDSNFNLDLTGFVNQQSVCTPDCGDGVRTPDEDCDHGDDNDDVAYAGCTVDCTLGPRCGDATLQADFEECDDGTNLTTYSVTGSAGCAPGCVLSAFCGDAQVDGLFGEQCDDGVNAGGYNGCDSDCTLGPRCGDGELQPGEEQCDDGDLVGGDGCSADCDLEAPK